MYPMPNVNSMGGQELLDVYNRYVGKTRSCKFRNLEEGREAVMKVWKAWAKENPPKPGDVTETMEVPAAEAANNKEESVMARTAAAIKEVKAKSPKAKKAPKEGASSRSRVEPEQTITVLVESNPHREGSDARRFFDVARKSKTVGQYLHKIDEKERALAGRWLWNFVNRNGTIKLD